MIAFFAAWLAIGNLWTAARFWQDKQRAIQRVRRNPKADPLTLAFLGGTPRTFLARPLFRHKPRKESFSAYLNVTATVPVGVVIGLFLISGSCQSSLLSLVRLRLR